MKADGLVNAVTAGLAPYPMEELKKIRQALEKEGRPIFDFGTGDPTIPTWAPIREAIAAAVPIISQYPSVLGIPSLKQAQLDYLERRYQITAHAGFDLLPAAGTKEAIFHIALILIGRDGGKRKRLIYPNPGYPVYQASALFAGGIPTPVNLEAGNGYLLEPWKLPAKIANETAAIWVNYPHNPTGALAPVSYWKDLVAWCHRHDVILLADECYGDIYDPAFDATPEQRPFTPLALTSDRILAFFSLSKRSGMTGHRAGFTAGDSQLIKAFAKARANFGVGQPDYVQKGAVVAWQDDLHVAERRRVFRERMQVAGNALMGLGLIKEIPRATFYLWAQVPAAFKGDDVAFCLQLAKRGLIASPSRWLGEDTKGYFRLALVPELPEIKQALGILEQGMTPSSS